MSRKTLIAALAGSAFVAGCVETPPEERGARMFRDLCSVCHGTSGTGDGAIANDLRARPADLTRLAEDNGGVFPVEAVMAQVYGYPGRYHQSIMPEFGPLLGAGTVPWQSPSGEVIDTPPALLDLTAYLASIQG